MSLQNYKVLHEDGVTIDDTEFAQGEILELDSESEEVMDLLAEGSLEVEADSGASTNDTDAAEAGVATQGSPEAEKALFYGDKKIVGNVVDVEGGYKSFTTEGGETFKLTNDDYANNVNAK